MGSTKHKQNEEENYLVQKINEHVQCKGIPSRVLLQSGLAHLVVTDGNEVLKLFKLHFPKCLNVE